MGVADYVRSDIAPYLVGYAGEIAVAIYFGRGIDDRLLADGDCGSDITVGKSRIQIKTRRHTSTSTRDKTNLIRVVNRHNAAVTWPTAPLLIFCEVNSTEWTVAILGWCKTACIKNLPIIAARKGDHRNVEVPDSMLEPMSSLKALIHDPD